MSNFKKLSRAEMKDVLGGLLGGGDCAASACSSDTDCTSKPNVVCIKSTCLATGVAANYCGVAA